MRWVRSWRSSSSITSLTGRTGIGAKKHVGSAGSPLIVELLEDRTAPSAGSLDATFAGIGKLTTAIGSANDVALSTVIDGNGRIVVAGFSFNGSNNDFAVARYNQNGSLDTSFNGTGKAITAVGSADDRATAVASDGNGRIVVAGTSDSGGGNTDFALARYNPDGSLDTTFDSDGKVITPFGSLFDQASKITIDANGKIVVVGRSYDGSEYHGAVVRYNQNGSLDTTFDGDGKVTIDFNGLYDDAQGVAIDGNGKIVVVGSNDNGVDTTGDFALARLNQNGSFDTTFDGDGKVTIGFGSPRNPSFPRFGFFQGVAIDGYGRIVASGGNPSAIQTDGSQWEFALARFNQNGSLDTTFDGDGKVTTDFGPSEDYASSLAIDSNGKILAAGHSGAVLSDFALARYKQDGSLDTTFDGDGKVTTTIGVGFDRGQAMAIDGYGNIVVAGSSSSSYGGDADFALARYQGDGSLNFGNLDPVFDGDGKLTTSFGSGDDLARGTAIDGNGRIVIAGFSYNGTNNDFALARYHPDGSLDTSFDNDGKVTTDFGSAEHPAEDQGLSMAIDGNGKIVVAGFSIIDGNEDFALARYNENGSLDTTFDFDGKVTTAIGSSYDRIAAVAIDGNGKIVVAGRSYNGDQYEFALARYNQDGSLDTSFDSDGRLTIAFGSVEDQARSVAIDGNGNVVVAGDAYIGSNPDFALARVNQDGSLDNNFDGDGKLTTAIGSGNDFACA